MEKYYYKGEQIWRTDFLNLIKKIGVKRNYNEPQWKSFIGAVKSGNKAAVALFRDIKIEINGFAIEM